MSSRKRCQKSHSIRPGIKSDTSVTFVANKGKPPTYVLLCDNQQVGAMIGAADHIAFLEIFEPHREVKHSEVFLELLEQEARSQGVKRITMGTPTDNPKMIRALERCGFVFEKEEPDGNRWYYKDL